MWNRSFGVKAEPAETTPLCIDMDSDSDIQLEYVAAPVPNGQVDSVEVKLEESTADSSKGIIGGEAAEHTESVCIGGKAVEQQKPVDIIASFEGKAKELEHKLMSVINSTVHQDAMEEIIETELSR